MPTGDQKYRGGKTSLQIADEALQKMAKREFEAQMTRDIWHSLEITGQALQRTMVIPATVKTEAFGSATIGPSHSLDSDGNHTRHGPSLTQEDIDRRVSDAEARGFGLSTLYAPAPTIPVRLDLADHLIDALLAVGDHTGAEEIREAVEKEKPRR